MLRTLQRQLKVWPLRRNKINGSSARYYDMRSEGGKYDCICTKNKQQEYREKELRTPFIKYS